MKGKKLSHKSLSQRVYEIIRDMIIARKLKPGQRIIEVDLAAELGVSRTPVKRALTKLNEEGLVEALPRQGTFVKKFLLKDALAIYDVREVLEGLASRLAASSITDKEIRGMKKLFEGAEEFIKKRDFDAYVKVDMKFHKLLAQASGNEIVHQIITNFHLQIRSFHAGVLIRPPSETLKDHLAIIDALAKHEPDLAEKLVRQHIRTSRKRLPSRLFQKKEALKS